MLVIIRAVIIAKTGQFLSSYHQKHHHPVVEVIGDGLTIGGWLLVTTLQLHIVIGGIFIGKFFHTILILGNFRIKMRNPIICPDPQLSRTVTTQIVTSWYPFARKMIAMRIVTRVVMVNLLAVGLSRTPTKNSIQLLSSGELNHRRCSYSMNNIHILIWKPFAYCAFVTKSWLGRKSLALNPFNPSLQQWQLGKHRPSAQLLLSTRPSCTTAQVPKYKSTRLSVRFLDLLLDLSEFFFCGL